MRMLRSLLSLCLLSTMAVSQESEPSVAQRLGYPADARLLIIHADDAGMMHSVNRATIEALEQGWITSASILVPSPWFPEFARWAGEHPEADLGIHLAVNSEWTPYRWGPVSSKASVPSLLDEEGYLPLNEELALAQINPGEAEKEYRAQIERALAWGIRLTHLDSHMSTMPRSPELVSIYEQLGHEYGLPILHETDRPPSTSPLLVDRILQIGPEVAAEDWEKTYKLMLAELPPGVYQLIVHLGHDDEELQGATFDHPDWGAAWRQRDFDLVRSPDFRQFLKDQGFILITWREIAKVLPADYKAAGEPEANERQQQREPAPPPLSPAIPPER